MLRAQALDAALADLDVEVQTVAPDTRAVSIPVGEHRTVSVAITANERSVSLQAFVLRRPDRSHEAVYARLLGAHWTSGPWRFALDDLGDVHALATLPAADAEAIDGALGSLSFLVGELHETLVRTGFDVS